MPRRNAKNTVPVLTPGSGVGRPLRRADFLGGTIHTYWGPGQSPRAIDTYSSPVDWIPTGYPLYMPQVAWLSVVISDQFDGPYTISYPSHSSIRVANNSTFTLYMNQLGGIYPDADPGPTVDGFTATEDNPAAAEHDRLLAEFESAKATIEALRPGRTWVEALDWFTDPDGFDTPFNISGNYWIPAFSADTGNWLGTDFLHVHCGTAHITLGYPTRPSTPQSRDIGSDTLYTGFNRPRLVTVEPKFRQFSPRYFGPRHPTCSFSGMPITGLPPLPGGDWSYNGSNIALAWTPTYNSAVSERARLTTDWSSQQNYDRSDMQWLASDLSAYDASYVGDTDAVDASSLVELIAAHFNFDPGTGEDL